MIECRSGYFRKRWGFEPISSSSSGMKIIDFNIELAHRSQAKNILEHRVSEISNLFARSLLSSPSRNFINTIKNSPFDDTFLDGPKRADNVDLNFLTFLAIDITPVHLLVTNGEINPCNLLNRDLFAKPV
ncbi:hypothetical protein DPMN_027543 [Dreissena polymorpha]|uniref:Uncharacterized protein n=1 Tax=Dreissena polymorpha TaxID=45954 RepID=A0A9D4RDR0_DREPO|nr:hypothetical protein DPMN_027543 [Dreissena polymorpha]